jgi:hypothetical protein
MNGSAAMRKGAGIGSPEAGLTTPANSHRAAVSSVMSGAATRAACSRRTDAAAATTTAAAAAATAAVEAWAAGGGLLLASHACRRAASEAAWALVSVSFAAAISASPVKTLSGFSILVKKRHRATYCATATGTRLLPSLLGGSASSCNRRISAARDNERSTNGAAGGSGGEAAKPPPASAASSSCIAVSLPPFLLHALQSILYLRPQLQPRCIQAHTTSRHVCS